MSEPDKYYVEARAMVTHCRYCDRDYKCPQDLEQDRQDVAAALRAQGAEIERLKAKTGFMKCVERDMDIAQLKALVVKLQAQQTNCLCVCHDFPEHGKLQDALEANRFHSVEIVQLHAEIERLKNQAAEFDRQLIYHLDRNAANVACADAEIESLKAETERLRFENAALASAQPGREQDYYFLLQGAKEDIAALKAQLATAEQRGMEKACKVICNECRMNYHVDWARCLAIEIRVAMAGAGKSGD